MSLHRAGPKRLGVSSFESKMRFRSADLAADLAAEELVPRVELVEKDAGGDGVGYGDVLAQF